MTLRPSIGLLAAFFLLPVSTPALAAECPAGNAACLREIISCTNEKCREDTFERHGLLDDAKKKEDPKPDEPRDPGDKKPQPISGKGPNTPGGVEGERLPGKGAGPRQGGGAPPQGGDRAPRGSVAGPSAPRAQTPTEKEKRTKRRKEAIKSLNEGKDWLNLRTPPPQKFPGKKPDPKKIEVHTETVAGPSGGLSTSKYAKQSARGLAVLAMSGFGATFKKMGLKAKIGANGRARILDSKGRPASPRQLSELRARLAAEPTALLRRPDFYKVLPKSKFSGLKQDYVNPGNAIQFKHIDLTPERRGFSWNESCHTLSGDCNPNAFEKRYMKGKDVSPETLGNIDKAIHKNGSGKKEPSGEIKPTKEQLSLLARVEDKLSRGVFGKGGAKSVYRGIGGFVNSVKKLFGIASPMLTTDRYGRPRYAGGEPGEKWNDQQGTAEASAGRASRGTGPAKLVRGVAGNPSGGENAPIAASSGPWSDAQLIREGRFWFWLIVLLIAGGLIFLALRRRRAV